MLLIEVETPQGMTFIKSGCWLREVDGQREVWVNHALFLRYSPEDACSQRFAAACLAQAGVAPKTRIGEAFGYHRNYVAELAARLDAQGLEGMLEGKRGPKSPHKLHPHIRRRARELRQQGLSLQSIARQLQQEWGVSTTHTSVRRMVMGIEVKRNEGQQASLDGAWPLALPLFSAGALSSASLSPDVPIEADQVAGGALTELPEVEGASGILKLPEPVVNEGKEFSSAGGFLYYPALAALGLVEAFVKVYHRLACRRYGLREMVLTLFFLLVTHFHSVEAFKGVQQRDFRCLIGARSSPALKTLRRKLEELAGQKRAHRLLMEMARRYVHGDIIELGVLYADGHMKPYYGSRSIGEVWSPLRRMGMPGFQQYFVNDRAGRPLFFLTAQAQERSLVQMLPKLVEHIRSVIGEQEFTLVFDRGGYSPELFRILQEDKVCVITYRKRPFDPYPAEAFIRQWCQFEGERHEYQIYEQTIQLRKLGPIRNIAVLRRDGRQTHILTTDRVREAPLVAHLMFNRWGQENFFKYMIQHYSLDMLHDYGSEAMTAELSVANPQRQAVVKQIQQLSSQIKALREELGTLASRRAKEEQMEPLRQQLATLEDQRHTLTRQRRQMPARVPLEKTGLKRDVLDLEKKAIMDTIKIAAYNAEEWLLQRLNDCYDDPRDIRQVLCIFTGLKGQLRLRNGDILVDLNPPEIPKYRKALEGLCAKLNALSTDFPGTLHHIKFAVAGTEVHTKPHNSTTPMS